MESSLLSGVQAQTVKATATFHRPHNTVDKPPRLMVKQFSIAKNTQIDSHTYIGKRRGKEKKEKKMIRNHKEESNQSNNQTPK